MPYIRISQNELETVKAAAVAVSSASAGALLGELRHVAAFQPDPVGAEVGMGGTLITISAACALVALARLKNAKGAEGTMTRIGYRAVLPSCDVPAGQWSPHTSFRHGTPGRPVGESTSKRNVFRERIGPVQVLQHFRELGVRHLSHGFIAGPLRE